MKEYTVLPFFLNGGRSNNITTASQIHLHPSYICYTLPVLQENLLLLTNISHFFNFFVIYQLLLQQHHEHLKLFVLF
jgi:hypothetical protein